MSKEVTLRELARIYARGGMDRNSYHKSRAELINGIIKGRIRVKDIAQISKQDKAASGAEGGEQTDNGVTEIRPEMPAADVLKERRLKERRPDKRLLLIFIGIGVVAILAALITLVVLLLQNSLT